MKNNLINSGLKNVINVKNYTQKQIDHGLSKKYASTGTLINRLHGAARQSAKMANIGGGSKAIGGKGMAGGMKAIINNIKADTILKTVGKISKYKSLR